MQDELRTLRSAQEIVGEMISAEEGRSRLHHVANFGPAARLHGGGRAFSPAELDAGFASSSSSSTSTAGDGLIYGMPPPRYEEELEGEMTVVDGFQYTPTGSVERTLESDDTPDSSVVDCSPRLSVDTGRTTFTIKEARDGS